MRPLDVLILASLFTFLTATPLDDYVNKADPSYDYFVLEDYTRHVDGYKVYILNMTSQTWLNKNEVDRSVWWHYQSVTIPDKLRYPDMGFMFITGGTNNGSPPDPLLDTEILLSSTIAVTCGMVASTLRQVPNQPIVFKDDPKKNNPRTEDAAVAFTWNHFITDRPDEPEYLLELPMTKAAIRGFDTMKDWAHKIRPEVNLTQFVPAGLSKRGWATWLTGAVDKRVVAMVPIVLDLLNIVKNLHHHYRSLGGWTFAFEDYYNEKVSENLDNPNTQIMADIIDPFAYRHRLKMHKYIITSSNDEFFLPDDSNYYFDQMEGPTYMWVIPNEDHSMDFHKKALISSISAFMMAVKEDWMLPVISWKRYQNASHGIIEFKTDQTPLEIKAWKARSSRRDWRWKEKLLTDGNLTDKNVPNTSIFLSYKVTQMSPSIYVAAFHRPYTGWDAFTVEATYMGPNDSTLKFSSEMHIMPDDAWALPDCKGADCLGTIIN